MDILMASKSGDSLILLKITPQIFMASYLPKGKMLLWIIFITSATVAGSLTVIVKVCQ